MRLRGLESLRTLFGPDAQAPVTKNGATAEAARREANAMQNVAQNGLFPKLNLDAGRGGGRNSFGIADPHAVTDLRNLPMKSVQAEAEDRVGYRFAGQIEMSISEWGAIGANPRQRDTELHARKAKHLREYDPIHRFVSMAILPDGLRMKLDGHTRAWLWERGEVQAPAGVTVNVFACETQDIAEALYSKFDSQAAVETGPDKIAGAARRQGLAFESSILRSGRYGSAVKRLFAYTTKTWGQSWGNHDFVYDAVQFYAAELRLLDEVNPQQPQFPAGVIMASLATLKRRGTSVMPFWKSYAEQRGISDGTRMDGVMALMKAVSKAKEVSSASRATGGGGQQLYLLGKGILTCEAFRSGQDYAAGKRGGVRSMDDKDLVEYLRFSREA